MNHPHAFLITLILAPLAILHAAETVAIPDGWRGSAGPGKVSAAAGAVAVERDAKAADDFAAVAEAQALGEGFYVFSGKARTAATASGAAAILARKASGESLREWKTPQLDAGCSGWRDFSVRLFAPAETAKFQVILTSSAGKVEFKDLKLEKTTWLEGRGTAAPKLEFWINMDYYDNVTSSKGLGLEGYGEKEITDYFKTCRQKGVTGVHWRASALGQMQYPSKVATPFPGRLKMERLDPDQARFAKTLTEIDPLAIAVREAKKNSIELYLWMTLIDEGYNHPTIGDFFFSDFQLDHPHTMLLNRKGEPLKGTICYNEPEAFAYRINIVKELLSYGADGLYLCNRTHNWSFGRNDGDEYGFNPAVVAEYRKRYGTDILTQDFDVKKWRGIRAEAYDRLIEEVAKLTHAAGQKVRLGVGNSALSGGPLGPNWGKLRVDWRRYVKEGWVDSIVSGQDKLSHYLAGAEMNQFRRVAKAGQKLYFWAEMNNWRGGGMYPPEDLLQQAEAFAFFGANGGIHHESLNLESADGVTKYFDPLTQFYLSVNSAGAAVPSASSSSKPQDIEWNTPQFIANSRQPPEGMMHPGEIRLAGPRTMQAGEPLRCGLRAVPPAVPISYHGVYRKVELRPELRIALLDAQGKTVASEPLNFAPEQWQRVPLAKDGLPPGNYTLRGEILVEGGSVFSRVDKDLRVLSAEEFKKLAALQKDARGIADAAGLKTTKLAGGPATLGEAVLIPKGCETAIALPGQGRVAVYGLLAPPSATFVATLGATKRNMSAFQDETYIMREVFLGVGSGGVDTVRVLSGEGEVRFAGIRVEPLSEDVSFVPGAGNQGRQLVVNNDGASEGFHNPGWSPQSVLEQVDRYQGSDVSQFEFQTHLGEMANYRSRYVDFYGEHFKGTWPTKGYEAQFRHYDLLDKQEPRLFPRLNARCGEIGLTFWGSQRMNADYGYHAEYAELFHSRFQKEHPEVRVQKSPSDTEPSFLLSYANAGVRERRIGVLRELAEFGCAGVNLDFCRYPTVLGYEEPMLKRFTEAYGGDGTTVPFDDPRWTRVRQEVMNGFLREVRAAMNEEGKKRGRPVRVSVRLPATKYETFGFDPQTWIREGLVDVLIPAFPGWERWFDIAPWAAMAKGSKVEVWPGTEFYFHETSTGELTDQDAAAGKKPGAMWILSRADYLRRAAEAYAAGAQGFYMFNAWDRQHVHLTRGISDSKFVANWRRYLDPENLGSEHCSRQPFGGRPKNLVPNSGFEEGLVPWKTVPLVGETATVVELDGETKSEGKSSARITANDVTGRISLHTSITVQEGRRYTLSFRYRTKDFHATKAASTKGLINFNKKDGPNGSAGSDRFDLPIATPTTDWQTFTHEFSAPAETVIAQVVVIQMSGVTGTIWIDDVSILPIEDVVAVQRSDVAPQIDGILSDHCWLAAQPLGHFYTSTSGMKPAKTGTTAYVTYDAESLYFAFRNAEPDMTSLESKATERDGEIWKDDANEIYIAAPNGKAYQFSVNCSNVQADYELYVRVPGDPWGSRVEWNGQWQSATSRGAKEWVTEVQIPVGLFESGIKDGESWRVNLRRLRSSSQESTQWNPITTAKAVDQFATLKFADGSARIARGVQLVSEDPLGVKRKSPKFAELLGNQPGNYSVLQIGHGFYLSHYPKSFQENYTPEAFRHEQDNYLAEFGQAGLEGPHFPWVETDQGAGLGRIRDANRRFGMKFGCTIESSSLDLSAFKQGATFFNARNPDKPIVDHCDPVKRRVMAEGISSYFKAHPQILPFLGSIEFGDEPGNAVLASYARVSRAGENAAFDAVDSAIRRDYGFGRYGLFESAADDHPLEASALRNIAFWRWWNSQFSDVVAQYRDRVKQHAPNIPFGVMTQNYTRGISSVIHEAHAAVSDWAGCDPYPSSTLAIYGAARARFHTGFSCKLTNDVTGGKRTRVYVQAFNYHAHLPRPSDLREWASQALKNGAVELGWWAPNCRWENPSGWKEMLRLSNLVHRMKRLQVPEETKTLVLFSNHSRWAGGNQQDAEYDPGHAYYTLYSILGENLRTWFRFASETTLSKGFDYLDRYHLVYVPQLKFSDTETGDRLCAFVKQGGTLVVLDPEAFQWNIDGTRHAARDILVGGRLGSQRAASSITIGEGGYAGLAAGVELPLSMIRHRAGEGDVMAYDITPPPGAKVIAHYRDGKPAAYLRTVGNGKVIYFGAQPFGDSSHALEPGRWAAFFRTLAGEIGEPTGLPIWDFLLPETGGEIPVNYMVPPK